MKRSKLICELGTSMALTKTFNAWKNKEHK
jgi:hypothetical protein